MSKNWNWPLANTFSVRFLLNFETKYCDDICINIMIIIYSIIYVKVVFFDIERVSY